MFIKIFPLALLVSAGCLLGVSATHSLSVSESNINPDISTNYQPQAKLGKSAQPQDRVTDIAKKANEWTEPSLESEFEYVAAFRDWLNSLPAPKREKVWKILTDAHPSLHLLRNAIRDKKAQLASLSYGRGTTPETLPRLGLQLQQLKAELHAELGRLKTRVSHETGVDLGPLGKDAFWLSIPSDYPK